ncbi:MAG: hypothetical protein Q8P41_13330 [Pseudomonadota bacterium]|nr:hypothetical protein [Pseudomonadota bacterium]
MLVALVLAAHAKADPVSSAKSCSPTFVVADAVPGPGAAEVPFDARPAITFVDGTCSGGLEWAVGVARTADEADVPVTSESALADTHLLELFPEEPFEPDTAYTITLTPLDSGELVELGFTTGTGEVAGLTGAPQLTPGSATFDKRAGTLTFTWTAKGAADPDGLSILQVRDANVHRSIHSFVVPGTGSMGQAVEWEDSIKPDEVCAQVRQIDGTGAATEWSEPVCTDLVGGCSTTGTNGGGVALIVAAALLSRRRSLA